MTRYFGKGRMILVEGELQTRTYTDKNGVNVKVTEILADRLSFTGEKSGAVSADGTAHRTAAAPQNTAAAQTDCSTADTDDDYPF